MNSNQNMPLSDTPSNPYAIQYGIYVHVPFCRQSCSYCDFYFVTRQQLIPAYTDALLNELKFAGPTYIRQLSEHVAALHPQPQLVSVYFGGGTPSRLPATDIARIMETIDHVHGLSHVQEVTLEANPDDVTSLEYLLALKSAGITRLSMGVQSFNTELLRFMHRAHTANEARHSLELIREAGFHTFTADLIYGNPGQTLEMLDEDITELLRFDPPHVSAYALTIEPDTRLGRYAKLGRLHEPDDTMVSAHMQRVAERFDEHGLHRYEVSNFAQSGHKAVHNSSYWEHIPYLGAGPGAHSLLMHQLSNPDGSPGTIGIRWENEPDLKRYIDANGTVLRFNEEHLQALNLAEERLLMGMRTRKGVPVAELAGHYGYRLNEVQLRLLERFRAEGLMNTGDTLQLTEKGLSLADRITLELISC
jgi:oxygen-independent coproporphyrinogen III oxidase